MNEEIKPENMRIHSRADELIACIECEIAKLDARIMGLESAAESLRISRDYHHEQENEYRRRWAGIYAAPVSEAKAQGVVQWPDADEIMQMAFEEGQPADDASGYCFELEEFDLFIERLMSEVARLNAAPAQHPKCKTCDDNGLIGGPSFYSPDEGGEPCPDCCSPVQQVSVPGGWRVERGYSPSGYVLHSPSGSMVRVCDSGGGGIETAFALFLKAMLAAAPAAPAQDVAGWIPVTERLPEVAQEVIVSAEFEGVCAGILDSYGEWFAPCSEYKLTRVTHWMPLPAAPESPK